MRVSSVSLIALLALLPTTANAAPRDGATEREAERARKYALGYFLPKGRAAASFSQRLVRSPRRRCRTMRASIVSMRVRTSS